MLIVSRLMEDGRTSGMTFIMKDSPDFDAVKRIMTEHYGEGRLELEGDGSAGYKNDRGYCYHTEDKSYFVIATS